MTDLAPQRDTTSLTLPLRVADLPSRVGVSFRVAPEAGARADLARELGIPRLRKLTFAGSLRPDGRHDWVLEGVLGATVVQDCVITAEPVTTRIDTPVLRRFLRRMPEVEGVEVEIPEDDSIEPLGPVIDPGAVMAEALALALPDYPRADGATLDSTAEARPEGAAPLTDAPRRNPFAALADFQADTPPDSPPSPSTGDDDSADS